MKRILQSNCGVFAAIAKVVNGEVQILVNVRTDRAKQLELAGLPADSTVQIIDLPGGGVDQADKHLFDALKREIQEELKIPKEEIHIHGPEHLLATVAVDLTRKEQDMAMVWAVKIDCEPQTSAETSKNLWVSEREITEGTAVRCPGLHKYGRMWQMLMAGFKYWGDVYYDETMSAKSGN